MISSLEGSGTPVRPAVRRRARTASPCTSRSSGGFPSPARCHGEDRPPYSRCTAPGPPGTASLGRSRCSPRKSLDDVPRYATPGPPTYNVPEPPFPVPPGALAAYAGDVADRTPCSKPGSPWKPRGTCTLLRASLGRPEAPHGTLSSDVRRVLGLSPVAVRRVRVLAGAFLSAFGVPRERPREYGAGTSPRSSPIPRGTVRSPPGTKLQIRHLDGFSFFPAAWTAEHALPVPPPDPPVRSWGSLRISPALEPSTPRPRTTPGA